jgi:hypothetical protein
MTEIKYKSRFKDILSSFADPYSDNLLSDEPTPDLVKLYKKAVGRLAKELEGQNTFGWHEARQAGRQARKLLGEIYEWIDARKDAPYSYVGTLLSTLFTNTKFVGTCAPLDEERTLQLRIACV